MRIHEHDFEDEDIVVDFHEFDHCTFTNCRMIIHGYGSFKLQKSEIKGCTWQFAGPAAHTIQAMAKLYSGGGKELVERTFDVIRSGGSPEE